MLSISNAEKFIHALMTTRLPWIPAGPRHSH